METKLPKRFPIRGLLIGILLLLLVGLFAIPVFFSNMVMSGEEFCPQLFQKRTFSYYRIPGTKIRVSGTTLSPAASPCSTPVLTHLAANSPLEWHVVTVSQGSRGVELGPKILLDYLKTLNVDGANEWDAWSFQNPALAKTLWPIVQQAAEKNLYFCVPDLLRAAKNETDRIVLHRKLCLTCIAASYSKIKSIKSSKDPQIRAELQDWAFSMIKEFGDDEEFLSKKSDIESLEE